MSIAQSTASEMVDRLVHLGWMAKEKYLEDRRLTVFTLTDKARQFLKKKMTLRNRVYEQVIESLSTAEQEKLLDSFETIVTLFGPKSATAMH